MTKPTFKEWCEVLFVVQPDAAKRFARTFLQLNVEDDEPLELLPRIQLGLFDWVSHLGLPDTWPWDLVQAIKKPLEIFAEDMAKIDENDADGYPMFQILLADHRFLGCTALDAWYDMEEAEPLEELPRPAVTHIHCDLTALYFRLQERVETLRKRKEAPDVAPARPAAEDGQRDAVPLRKWEPKS